MGYVVMAIAGYLFGNISSSYILGKIFKGIDVRDHGSGNAGATNAMRVMGVKMGVIVFALDVLKGISAVLIGWWLSGILNIDSSFGGMFTSLFAVIGHNWPIVMSFRGGKGIATSLGILFIMFPWIGLILFIFGLTVILITRFVSIASCLGVSSAPFLLWIFGYDRTHIIFGLILALIALYQHRSNIKRLLQGKENRINFRSQDGKA